MHELALLALGRSLHLHCYGSHVKKVAQLIACCMDPHTSLLGAAARGEPATVPTSGAKSPVQGQSHLATLPVGPRQNPLANLKVAATTFQGMHVRKKFKGHSLGVAHVVLHPRKPVAVSSCHHYAMPAFPSSPYDIDHRVQTCLNLGCRQQLLMMPLGDCGIYLTVILSCLGKAIKTGLRLWTFTPVEQALQVVVPIAW
jgi:hypothetical protein